MIAPADAVELRPTRASDEPFLRRLDAALRADEFAPLGLESHVLEPLLAMQYAARQQSHRQLHPTADFDLVLVAGTPAGRFYVERTATSIHLVEIALLPGCRGHGIGTRLLRQLLDEGAGSQRPVTLNALRGSRALALYRQLGFEVSGSDDVYLALVRRPPAIS